MALLIAVCDDNPSVVKTIIDHLKFFSEDRKIDFNIFSFGKSSDLLQCNYKFDIAILDIEIDNLTGLELGKSLRERNPHIILIYLTAYKKYLDEALNLNAVRFFEKPLDSKRFYAGLAEAVKRVDNSEIKFYLRDGKTINSINIQEIVYVEIDKRKSRLITQNGSYHSGEKMDFWKNALDKSFFAVPHKSYIVNLNYISTYERERITLCNKYQINVARNKQTMFRNKFIKFVEGK